MSQSNKKVKNVLYEHNSTRLTNGNTFKNILLLAIKNITILTNKTTLIHIRHI